MPWYPNPALTIFWDNRHEGRGLLLQHQDRLEAYIKLSPTATTQTVNIGLYRLLQPLDEPTTPISGQAHVQYPSVALGICPHPTITDQITDQYAPYCGELDYAACNDIRV